MSGPRDSHTKCSQRQISYDITYMWNRKYDNLIYKTERDSQALKTNLWLPEGKGINLGDWD